MIGVSTDNAQGVLVISFDGGPQGAVNQERVREFFAHDFLDLTDEADRVVVDLSGVISLDSSALGPLVQKLREARDRKGAVVLTGMRSQALKQIFSLTRFDQIFPIIADRGEAVATAAS